MDEKTYESRSRAFAFYMKVAGGAGIVFVPVFWAITNRVELAFLPFFGALAGVGQGFDILKERLQVTRSKDDDS